MIGPVVRQAALLLGPPVVGPVGVLGGLSGGLVDDEDGEVGLTAPGGQVLDLVEEGAETSLI
jgi:hypothetical protein